MTKSLLAIIIIAAVALAGCTGERHNRAFGGLDSIAETSPGWPWPGSTRCVACCPG